MRTRLSAAVVALACGTVVLSSGRVAWAEPIPTRGKVDAVTVYRGQAMVTRSIDLPDKAGLIEILVTDLPQRVVPGSLFAEGPDGVQVRSVLYRTRAVAQDVREEVRKIDDQLKALTLSATGIERQIDVIRKNAEYLTKLEQFVATSAQTELTRGVLNADTLDKLTTTVFSNREKLSKDQLAGETQLAAVKQQIELVQRQRAELTRGAADTAREALVMVDTKAPVKSIKLNYLVEGANWAPSYTLNASAGGAGVTLLYQASIAQMSGEEWKDVNMTLSTATPSVVSRAPVLSAMTLSLKRNEQAAGKGVQDEQAYADQLRQKRDVSLKNFSGANSVNHGKDGQNVVYGEGQVELQRSPFTNGFKLNDRVGAEFGVAADVNVGNVMVMNEVAQELQTAEFTLKDKSAVRSLSRREEMIAITYQLPGRTTLQSRADQQLVGISTVPMKAAFYKVAVPVLTPYVYDEAEVTNDSKTVLLAGPCVSYMNGQFVGQGDIPTTFVGGSFTAGFGVDPSLRATRELVDRTESTQGGNQITTFDYRLTIENFGQTPAKIRLLDRMPRPDGVQLKPTLVSSTSDLSKDPEYERSVKKHGLLRFDIDVDKNAVNGDAKVVDYKMTIEHDKQMTIAGAKQ